MSERSSSTSLEEKCCLSLAPASELTTPVSQGKSEESSDLHQSKNLDTEEFINDNSNCTINSNSATCDTLSNSKKLSLISKELGETDICPEVLSSQSDNSIDAINCKDGKLIPEIARTNGLICSFSDKVVTNSPSLPTSDENILQANDLIESSHSSNKSLIDNLPPEICKLETTVNSYNFNKDNNNEYFETKLKNVSNEEVCSTNICENNNKIEITNEGNTDTDQDTGDENLPVTLSYDESSEHDDSEDHHEYEKSLDNIHHVPKNPVYNGNLIIERRSNLKRKAIDDGNESCAKRKRTIQFEGVTVFYFPRSQGFTCVPSQGGSTLGMSRKHFSIRNFSLTEHAAEQRRSHRDYLLRLRQQRNKSQRKETGSQCSSSEESEENSEEASDVSDSELESDSFFFLQPLPIRQRRALLRQSGIRQIEGLEKDDCKDIRISREMCGCQCKVYCDPITCQCAEAGIKCQVDRHSFPCGCSRDGCNNPNGRIEFNPIRVRTHFLHTLMRLEIEKCQNQHQLWSVQQHDQQYQLQRNDGLDGSKSISSSTSWLQTNSGNPCSTNSFVSSGNVASSVPFFASQDSAPLQMNPSGEMHPCNVGTSALYSHFEVRQLNNNGLPVSGNNGIPNNSVNNSSSSSSIFQHDNDGDYNSGGCSMFSDAVMSSFDSVSPLLSYGGNAGGTFSTHGEFSSHCSYAHNHSKLPPSSPFSISSFSYSAAAAAAAAAVAVVSPGNCSYSLQNSFNSNEVIGSNSSPCMSLEKYSPSNVYSQITGGMCSSQEFSSNYDNSPVIHPSKLNSFSLSDMLSDLGNESPCSSSTLHNDFPQCSSLSDLSHSSDCLEAQNVTQVSEEVGLNRINHSQFTESYSPSQASTSGKTIIDTFSEFESFPSLHSLSSKQNTTDRDEPSSGSSVTPNLLYNGCSVQSNLDLCLDFCANNSNLTHSGLPSTKNLYECSKEENNLSGILSSPFGKPLENENGLTTFSSPYLNAKVTSVEIVAPSSIEEKGNFTQNSSQEKVGVSILSENNNKNDDKDNKLCIIGKPDVELGTLINADDDKTQVEFTNNQEYISHTKINIQIEENKSKPKEEDSNNFLTLRVNENSKKEVHFEKSTSVDRALKESSSSVSTSIDQELHNCQNSEMKSCGSFACCDQKSKLDRNESEEPVKDCNFSSLVNSSNNNVPSKVITFTSNEESEGNMDTSQIGQLTTEVECTTNLSSFPVSKSAKDCASETLLNKKQPSSLTDCSKDSSEKNNNKSENS